MASSDLTPDPLPLPALQSTIQAAPQVRDKKADLRRLVPASVLKRGNQPTPKLAKTITSAPAVGKDKATSAAVSASTEVQPSATNAVTGSSTNSKDALYLQFLEEMQGLL